MTSFVSYIKIHGYLFCQPPLEFVLCMSFHQQNFPRPDEFKILRHVISCPGINLNFTIQSINLVSPIERPSLLHVRTGPWQLSLFCSVNSVQEMKTSTLCLVELGFGQPVQILFRWNKDRNHFDTPWVGLYGTDHVKINGYILPIISY